MMDIVNWLVNHKTELVSIATGVVTVASAIAALTPTPKDNTVVGKLYKILDWFALNVGKAKDTGKKN